MLRFVVWIYRRLRPAARPAAPVPVQYVPAQFAQAQPPGGGSPGQGPPGEQPTLILGQPLPPQQQPRRGLARIPRWVRWTAVIVVVVLFFRRLVAWAVIAALSAALHLFGATWHLPHVTFGWPWSSSSTSNTVIGPLVLQKIQGIDKPALGTETFNFVFTRKVSHNIGIWPCWYSATFYAVGHASATVDLNPGPAWWKPATGHYRLRVLRAPSGGVPGQVSISMALPLPQLPQTVHDVSVDNTLSKPVSSDHSWTYPGFGCGVLIRPQFSESVLYTQAQTEAFYQATHLASVTRPLIATAETQAVKIIRDNFLVPTVNALGYRVTKFSIVWIAQP